MTSSRTAIPPPRALQFALRKTTETLAKELVRPTREPPQWSESEWRVAKAVAVMHGVSPLLATRLRWTGPDDWQQFLKQQRSHTANRHTRIEELLRLLDRHTREEGIVAVALKGAALHAMGVYVSGERPMADVDLLVRPSDAERTARMLVSLGFHESSASWKERVFTPIGNCAISPLGEHANSHIKIELHERICEKLPWRLSDLSEVVFPVRSSPGLNDYPSTTALMLHLVLHAAGAMVSQSLRLLQLHDIALLSARMTEQDWNEVLRQAAGGRLWWALPPLQLTARYYDSTIPRHILNVLLRPCPLMLRKLFMRRALTDVSYSHLRIDAFPGIEWSQSAPLLLRYVFSRIRPTAEHMTQRKNSAQSGWAAGSEWSTLPQSRRIVHWLTSRQSRPVTMHAVRAAFAEAR